MRLTILLPCLNEEKTLSDVIQSIKDSLKEIKEETEILVADNGSTDNSIALCEKLGVRVAKIPERGYGAALIGGIQESRGDWVIYADADGSYDFRNIIKFYNIICNDDCDMILGSRFKGKIHNHAMPFLNRYLGTPLLNLIIRLLTSFKTTDCNSGMRAVKKETFHSLNLKCKGMEFASEMILKAAISRVRYCEIPIDLYPDDRDRPPHLNRWSDGWRHLYLILMMGYRRLLMAPGFFFTVAGLSFLLWQLGGPYYIGGIYFGTHWMLGGLLLFAVGQPMLSLGYIIDSFSSEKTTAEKLKTHHLLSFLILGAILLLIGIAIPTFYFFSWLSTGMYGVYFIPKLILSLFFVTCGINVITFLLSREMILFFFEKYMYDKNS